jgi:hypothetical protein
MVPRVGAFLAHGHGRCIWESRVGITAINDAHGPDESIAFADRSFQEAGFRSIVMERRTKFRTRLLIFRSVAMNRSERHSFETITLRETKFIATKVEFNIASRRLRGAHQCYVFGIMRQNSVICGDIEKIRKDIHSLQPLH